MLGALQSILFRQPCPTRGNPETEPDGATPDTQPSLSKLASITNDSSIEHLHNYATGIGIRGPRATGSCDERQPSVLHGLLDNTSEVAAEKQDFFRTCSNCYGYGGQLESLRDGEFRRLAGQAYLDYAGAALYSERQIQACCEELLTTLLCNPHSGSPASDAMAALRRDTLDLLNADGRQYDVVITSGATAALKLVADCFPWRAGASRLAHPAAVHNSVLGMRGPALAAGAAVQIVQTTAAAGAACDIGTRLDGSNKPAAPALSNADGSLGSEALPPPLVPIVAVGAPLMPGDTGAAVGVGASATAASGPTCNLLVLPAECNFTGDREPLADVVRHVQLYGVGAGGGEHLETRKDGEGGSDGGGGGRWLVLLDAAKACATAPPDLSAVPADFVVLSYYKIFGHPTGLGALVARKEALALLAANKSYFGGGTVEVAVADWPYHVRRSGPHGLEDGTPAFTSIAAAGHGFAFLRRLGGLPAVHRHSCCLARWLVARLAALRHANGASACVLYGRWSTAVAAAAARLPPPPGEHGPTVCFNLLRPDGSWVGYAEVGRLAAMHGLHLRTGCFCNPGACAQWLGLSAEDVIRHHNAGHVCWDDHDLVDGRPTGAVRVSLGAASSFEDVFALLQLVRRYFVDNGGGGNNEASGDGARRTAGAAAGVPVALSPPSQLLKAAIGEPATATVKAPPTVTATAAAAAAGANKEETKHSSAAAEVVACAAATKASLSSSLRPQLERVARGMLEGGIGGGGRSGTTLAPGPGCRISAGVDRNKEFVGGLGAGGGPQAVSAEGRLSRILLYPVKSCAPQMVAAWPIGPTGLLYDREWALVDDSGKVLTLKQCPRMALVRPHVDLTRGTLTILAPDGADVPPLELAIPGLFRRRQALSAAAAADAKGSAAKFPPSSTPSSASSSSSLTGVAVAAAEAGEPRQRGGSVRLDAGLTMERVQVCGDTVCSDLVDVCHDSGGDARVRQWFVRVLGAPCRIVQQRTGARKVRRPAGQGGPVAVPDVASPSTAPAVRQGKAAAATPPPRAAKNQDELSSSHLPPPLSLQQQQQAREGERANEPADGGHDAAEAQPSVGFANDGQYLLVSEASMDDLRVRLREQTKRTAACGSRGNGDGGAGAGGAHDDDDDDDLVARFRPNLVVSGFPPYEEDSWTSVTVGPLCADVLGTCPRCELLQVDPRVGVRRGAEVLVALAQYRRRGGRVQFGVLLAASATASWPSETVACARGLGKDATAQPADAVGLPSATNAVVKSAPGIAIDWLRQEFGCLSVVAIGDPVQPVAGVGVTR